MTRTPRTATIAFSASDRGAKQDGEENKGGGVVGHRFRWAGQGVSVIFDICVCRENLEGLSITVL